MCLWYPYDLQRHILLAYDDKDWHGKQRLFDTLAS